MFIMQKGTYLSFHYFADVSGNKTKNQTMSAVLRQNDFHLTQLIVQVRRVTMCVSSCPPIRPSIRSLDKVHVSLSPVLSGFSHKLPLPERLMVLLNSNLKTAKRWTRTQTDLFRTSQEKRSSFCPNVLLLVQLKGKCMR